jgi:hypothetical protein
MKLLRRPLEPTKKNLDERWKWRNNSLKEFEQLERMLVGLDR